MAKDEHDQVTADWIDEQMAEAQLVFAEWMKPFAESEENERTDNQQ